MLTFAAPMASAQALDGLPAALIKDVACASPDATRGLIANIAASGGGASDIETALSAIARNTTVCDPVRHAAKYLAASTSAARSAFASSAVVSDALVEAERRAASMKFEVGPPPPRVAKDTASGL